MILTSPLFQFKMNHWSLHKKSLSTRPENGTSAIHCTIPPDYAAKTKYRKMPLYPCTFEASHTVHHMLESCQLGHNVSFDPNISAPLGSAFSHEIEQFIPILEGDILTPAGKNEAWLEDCTPESGAPYRVFMSCSRRDYSQSAWRACTTLLSEKWHCPCTLHLIE